jgi:Tfp pilus assembly protein PilF
LKLNPSLPQAWRWRGEVRALQARQDASFQAAASDFQKALELDPENLDPRLAYGAFLREWGATVSGPEARAHLQQGLSLTEAVLTARPRWKDASTLRDELRRAITKLPPE